MRRTILCCLSLSMMAIPNAGADGKPSPNRCPKVEVNLPEGKSSGGIANRAADLDGDGTADKLRVYCAERDEGDLLASCLSFAVEVNQARFVFDEEGKDGSLSLSDTMKPFSFQIMKARGSAKERLLLFSFGMGHGENESPFEVRSRYRVILSYQGKDIVQSWFQHFDGSMVVDSDGQLRVTKYECEPDDGKNVKVDEVWKREGRVFVLAKTKQKIVSIKKLGVDLCDY